MLGFDADTTYDGHAEHIAKLPMNLTGNVNLVYIYCDLVEQVLVGDTKAPLLRIVSRSTDMTSSLDYIEHVTFNPVQYVPLQKKCFDTITINLMMDTMDVILSRQVDNSFGISSLCTPLSSLINA